MKHFPIRGMSDEQIAEFFGDPIEEVLLSPLEGNRLFAAVIISYTGRQMCLSSCITELDSGDEIGVLSITDVDRNSFENRILLPGNFRSTWSVSKLIGEFGNNEVCECGLLIESAGGIISIMSGAFPASINVICPKFDQGLRTTSFQNFKYYLRRLKAYDGLLQQT